MRRLHEEGFTLLQHSDDAMKTQSQTDAACPRFMRAKTEKLEPSLTVLRKENVDPIFKKSSRETDEPSVVTPYKDMEEPNFKKLLSEMEEPMCT